MSENENKQSLREAINEITMEGILLEIEHREGKTHDGREYLQATLTIGVDEESRHDVEMFTMKFNNSGEVSGIYKSLHSVIFGNEEENKEPYKSVAKHGKDEADYVTIAPGNERFSNGQISRNDYVGRDGQLRSFPQLTTTFVNRVEDGEPKPHAKFETELVISRVTEETDKNEEETGRAILEGYIPVYGGKVIPAEFVVTEDGADYVLSNYGVNDTVLVYGNIVNKRIENVRKTEGAFGEDNKKITYSYVREFEVTGGSYVYEDGDVNKYDILLIKQALAEREVHLDNLKEKHKNKDDNKRKGGWDTTEKTKTPNISDDDLPF